MGKSREEMRKVRRARVRRKVQGTPEQPRLCVYKSSRHFYVQVIDDRSGSTLAAASTLSKELKGQLKSTTNKEAATEVGKLVAKKLIDKGIKKVVFDRNGFLYHGSIKLLADAAREAGLEF